jgi:hypothetical protein
MIVQKLGYEGYNILQEYSKTNILCFHDYFCFKFYFSLYNKLHYVFQFKKKKYPGIDFNVIIYLKNIK